MLVPKPSILLSAAKNMLNRHVLSKSSSTLQLEVLWCCVSTLDVIGEVTDAARERSVVFGIGS